MQQKKKQLLQGVQARHSFVMGIFTMLEDCPSNVAVTDIRFDKDLTIEFVTDSEETLYFIKTSAGKSFINYSKASAPFIDGKRHFRYTITMEYKL